MAQLQTNNDGWMKQLRNDPRRAVFAIVFVVASVYAMRYVLRNYVDFDIYLDATREMVQGDLNLYRSRAPVGAYLYPHFVLLPFAVLLATLPLVAIKVLYCLALGGITVWLLRDLERIMRHYGGMRWWHWALFGFLFAKCFSGNLHHGQLSLLVSAMLLRGVLEVGEGRSLRGGTWLGLAAALKLTPALFFPVLLITRRWRASAAMLTISLVCIFVAPWVFLGTAEHLRHLGDFADAVILPRLGVETGTAHIIDQSMSIGGTLPFVLQAQPPTEHGYQFYWANLGDASLRVVQAGWSLALLVVAGVAFFRRREDLQAKWYEQSAVAMVVMALFSPLTYTYHLAGLLLSAALMCRAAWPSERRALFAVTVGLFAISFTLRQSGLIGHHAWWLLDNAGTPHLAIVGLLAWLAIGPKLELGRANGTPCRTHLRTSSTAPRCIADKES